MSTYTLTLPPAAASVQTLQNYQLSPRARPEGESANLLRSVVLRLRPGLSSCPSDLAVSPATAPEESEMDELTHSTLFSPAKKNARNNLVATAVTATPSSAVNIEINDQIAFIRDKLLAAPESSKEQKALIVCGEEPQLVFQRELLQFQTQCNDPRMNLMIEGILGLKQKLKETSDREALMEEVIGQHAKGIYKDIAMKLFKVIKDNPILKKRYERLKLRAENVEIHSLLKQLEEQSSNQSIKDISEGWVRVEQNGKPKVVNIALEEIKRETRLC